MRWEYPINSDIQLFGLIVKIKKKSWVVTKKIVLCMHKKRRTLSRRVFRKHKIGFLIENTLIRRGEYIIACVLF
jgi:hypothetical protein